MATLSPLSYETLQWTPSLTEAGIVVEFTDRARNCGWRASEILDALDDFAGGAGRRG